MANMWSDCDEYSRHEFSKDAKNRSSARTASLASSPGDTYNEQERGQFLQPETRPITQEQLVNEVKGMWVGERSQRPPRRFLLSLYDLP